MKNLLFLLVLAFVVFSYTDKGSKKEVTYLHERGGLKYEVNEEKPFTGNYFTYWDVNGQKKKRVSYKDGKPEGIFTEWYVTGQKKEQMKVKDTYDVIHTSWFENGQKDKEFHYVRIDGYDGEKHYASWSEHNGQKIQEGSYVNGLADGVWTFWYENGQKQEVCNYKNGKKKVLLLFGIKMDR